MRRWSRSLSQVEGELLYNIHELGHPPLVGAKLVDFFSHGLHAFLEI